jgi:hypothetical protein
LKILQSIDTSPVKIGLPIQILLLLLESRFTILNLTTRNVDLRLKVVRVDLKKQIALPDLLVVSDRNMYNRTRDPRSDADDVGSDLAVSSPRICNVSRVEGNGCPDGQNNNDHRD